MTNRSFSLAPMSQSLRRVALLFGLAAVYYFAAKLGLRFAYINSSVTTIWPPTGLALGAYLVNRFARGGRVFNRVRDILRFTLLAALVSTVVSASSGMLSLLLGGLVSWHEVPRVWLTWWLGD